MKQPKESFGSILRRTRESRGLSIRALASQVNVHHSHLARIERCEAKPSLDLVLRLSEALEAPSLYFAFVSDNLPPEAEKMFEEAKTRLLQAQEQIQIEPANKSYPAEDPMLAYARIGPKPPEGTIYTTDEYIDIWEFNRFPVDWLFFIPPLRDKIIDADLKWHEQEIDILAQIPKPEEHWVIEAENAGYFAGYREAIQDTVKLLRQIYQEHGLYWLLAVVLIPPENARVISDFYSELEAINFDECAVRAVFDLLRAWKDRYYQSKKQDQNQETSSTENKG